MPHASKQGGSPVQVTGLSWLERTVLGHEDEEVSTEYLLWEASSSHPGVSRQGRGEQKSFPSQATCCERSSFPGHPPPQLLLYPLARDRSFRHQQGRRTLPTAMTVGGAKVLGSPSTGEVNFTVSREGCAYLGHLLVLSYRSGKATQHSATVLFLQPWLPNHHTFLLPSFRVLLPSFRVLLPLPRAFSKVYCHF